MCDRSTPTNVTLRTNVHAVERQESAKGMAATMCPNAERHGVDAISLIGDSDAEELLV